MATDEAYERELVGTRDDVATVLNEVAKGLRDGTVHLDDGMEAVTVEFPDELTLETELETGDDEVNLELELEWSAVAGTDGSSADVSSHEASTDDVRIGTTDELAEEVTDKSTGDSIAVTADAGPADPTDDANGGPESLAEFEVFRDGGREWRWRLRHRNGNIIATSGGGYVRKRGALRGVRSVVENTPGADVREEIPE